MKNTIILVLIWDCCNVEDVAFTTPHEDYVYFKYFATPTWPLITAK
jgi:hypothetical protein